ncbi:SEC-C metal-binding domain-containing protein [Photobacterium damselae]|uniref:SEC-C metal-binding domain-containing protein n=1 Tax=Photobacterium damselae TaxID=38293 RepID=UPI003D7C4380
MKLFEPKKPTELVTEIDEETARRILLKSRYRNMRCPCGSGKKFKRCCQLKVAESKSSFNYGGNWNV